MSMTVHSLHKQAYILFLFFIFFFLMAKLFVNICFNRETNFMVTRLFNAVITSWLLATKNVLLKILLFKIWPN